MLSNSSDFKFLEARPGITMVLLADTPVYTIVAVSNDFVNTSGRKREDVIGKSHFEIFPENPTGPSTGVHSLKNSFDYIVQHKTTHSLPLVRYDIPDGKGGFLEKYWKSTNAPVFNDNGEVAYVIHTSEDVTDQVLTEQSAEKHQELQRAYQQLEESEQELQLAIDAADLGTFRLDLLENKAVNSEKVNEWFGYTVQGYSRVEGFDPIHPEDRDHVDQVIVSTMQSEQQSHHDVTYRVVHPTTGAIRHLRSFGKTLFNEQGKPYLILGIIQNVTEQILHQNQLEESETLLQQKVLERTLELENLNRELQRSNANLEEFAYAASHDLKEPVRKIHFFSDRLKARLTDKLEAEDQRYFERMETAAQRMGTLIDDLLMYSHINRGVTTIEEVDLNQNLQNVLNDLELLIEDKGATILSDPLPTINGHKRQLQQLFENLIGNALKYSKQGVLPRIHIHTTMINGQDAPLPLTGEAVNKQYHLIEVADNGIGFNQGDAERIFNVFTRLHGNAEYKGTGVGLSIAQKVVENHNGYIWAESQPGEGATFKLLLPVH